MALPLLLPSAAMGQAASTKAPVTLGFANISGDDLAPLMKEDVAALSPIFTRVSVAERGKVPICGVLFLYAHLNADGTLRGTNALGVRKFAELSKASIIVLASPNSGESIVKSGGIAGPKSANLVYTVDRNGTAFPTFFRSLFERMRDGQEMLMAWVQLAPQGPVAPAVPAPQTILVAEAGKLAFPK